MSTQPRVVHCKREKYDVYIGKDTVEARIIIILRDKDGTEWEYNDCRKFKLKRKKVRP